MTVEMFDFNKLLDDSNVKIRTIPELPKYTYKVGKAKYSITNLKYLNETAIEMVLKSIFKMALGEECAIFDVTEMNEHHLEVVMDILSGIGYECKEGRGSNYTAGSLFGGRYVFYDGDKKILKQEFYKDNVEAIKKYAQDNDYKIVYHELAKALVDYKQQIWKGEMTY